MLFWWIHVTAKRNDGDEGVRIETQLLDKTTCCSDCGVGLTGGECSCFDRRIEGRMEETVSSIGVKSSYAVFSVVFLHM